MRRKRRSRGTWLPILGTPAVLGEGGVVTTDGSLTFQLAVDAPNDGSAGLGIIPITYDYPQEAIELSPTADTLAEIAGSEYIVKRILGHCVVANSCNYDNVAGDGADALMVSAGFFVARAGSVTGGPLGPAAPIGYGADTTSSDMEQYSPGNQGTVREPWMWRRTWILGNQKKVVWFDSSATQVGSAYFRNSPPTNQVADLRSGPYIDVKSRRRVGQDERLFFAIECRTLPLQTASGSPQGFDFAVAALTVRIFATLVKAKNTGTF